MNLLKEKESTTMEPVELVFMAFVCLVLYMIYGVLVEIRDKESS